MQVQEIRDPPTPRFNIHVAETDIEVMICGSMSSSSILVIPHWKMSPTCKHCFMMSIK